MSIPEFLIKLQIQIPYNSKERNALNKFQKYTVWKKGWFNLPLYIFQNVYLPSHTTTVAKMAKKRTVINFMMLDKDNIHNLYERSCIYTNY